MKLRDGRTLVVRPYSMRSKSAKALANALGCQRLQQPVGNVAVVNWGSGGYQGLNKPDAVSRAVNKVATLSWLKSAGVRTPDWTTDPREAKQWLREGATVMCRTKLNGHSGQGIVVAKTILDLVDAPLYTKYVNKEKEYRVHVFNGKVIDARQKVKATDGRAVTSEYINTHTNGYVFKFADPPSDARQQAINAVKALGLDFGAVDVVVESVTGTGGIGISYRAYVLEVNSAPGLTGTTITRYVDAIKEYFNGPS